MTAPHAFLDILNHPQVRDAFLAGRIALILSADLETVLWANGSGARFLGFRTVAEALNEAGGFSVLTRRAIAAALSSGRAVSVPGVEGGRDFLASRIELTPWGETVFLRSVAPAAGDGPLLLTEGLSDETSEAALVDDKGRLMSAGPDFNQAVLADENLLPLLAEAARDGGVKKRFLSGANGAKPCPVGVLRLNETPPVLLLIAAKTAAELPGNKAAGAFAFDEKRLPARFVFRTDDEGRFLEVSPELAETVGPACGDIAGRRFADLARAWRMDKSGAVRALLLSGNPWSEQRLDWPVQGAQKRAQIALAALPVYAADRRFMGFRGFGLIEKMVDNMSDDMRDQGENERRDLSREEQEAFMAIARRLGGGQSEAEAAAGSDNARAWDDEAGRREGAAAALAAKAAEPAPVRQTAGDIFAGMQAAMAAEPRRGAEAGSAPAAAFAPEAQPAAEPAAAAARAEAEAARRAQINAAAHIAAQTRHIAALEAEAEGLAYRNGRLDFLLNALSEGVVVMDKNSVALSANEAAGRLFGLSAAGLSGARMADMFDAAGAQALERDIAAAEAERAGAFLKPGREAATGGGAGGQKRLRLNFGCLEPGQSYFLLMRDMTRFHEIISSLLRRSNEEAEAGRRQARCLALISHEIRTPLSALLGMAQFMAEEKAGPIDNAKYKDYLADMTQAGSHIMALLNDILNAGGGKADWLTMDIAPMKLFDALNEALAMMTPRANAANIIIRTDVGRNLPAVLADARAVKQILLNLISNAVHFTPEGGQIIISAHEREAAESAAAAAAPGAEIVMRISDSGIGMTAAEIARTMRDPLADSPAAPLPDDGAQAGQTEADEKENGGDFSAAADEAQTEQPANGEDFSLRHGAGLGLPVARALAEANGIHFSLSSEPGRGTTATLIFRAAGEDKQQA